MVVHSAVLVLQNTGPHTAEGIVTVLDAKTVVQTEGGGRGVRVGFHQPIDEEI